MRAWVRAPLLAAPPRHVLLTAWRGDDLALGTHRGTVVEDGELRFGEPAGLLTYADPYAGDAAAGPTSYEWADWTSPAVDPGFQATAVLPSWNATTPDDGWLRVEARRPRVGAERVWSPWFTLANWADDDRTIHPTSVPGQDDAFTRVSTDVLDAVGETTWSSAQLRVTLVRPVGSESRAPPADGLPDGVAGAVRRSGAMPPPAARAGGWSCRCRPSPSSWTAATTGAGTDGGQSWCSPTSVAMLLAFHDRLPPPAEHAWVEDSVPQPFVELAARRVFDHAYHGAGNWAFNTAFAARPGVRVVRHPAAVADRGRAVPRGRAAAGGRAWRSPRTPCTARATAPSGHLLAVVGFTRDGDVICNDPASHQLPSNDDVRVVLRPRPSSSGPGWDRRAASSTSCSRTTYACRTPRARAGAATGDSAGGEGHGVPAGRPVGHHVGARRRSGCSRTGPWRGPRACARRRGTSRVPAHCTQVSSPGTRPSSASCQASAVEAVLHLLDPGVLRPGVAADPDRARPHLVAVAGHLDPRLRLHRPLRRPAAVGPEGARTGRSGSPRGRPATWWRTRSRRAPARPSAPGSRARRAAAHRSSPPRASRCGRRVSASSGVPQVQPSCGGLLHRVGLRLDAGLARAGRRPGRRSTRRCRSGRRRPRSTRSTASPSPRSACGRPARR